jgi:hypothetical protein
MPENKLMERIAALVQEHGTKWKTLTEILHAEGFTQDDGAPLAAEMVRQLYRRVTRKSETTSKMEKQQSLGKAFLGMVTDPEATSPPVASRHELGHTPEAMVPISQLLELFKGTIERRDAMLAQKLGAGDEKQCAEDRMVVLEARLEERLIRRLKEELIELVGDCVHQELRNMVTPDGRFESDLKTLVAKSIEEKFSGGLASLLDGIDVRHDHGGGPGRGHKDKRTARFSATMDEETYSRMKRLTGTFSSHLAAACKLYLRALESKREHTQLDSK